MNEFSIGKNDYSTYTYTFRGRKTVTLTAGQDGVTQLMIDELKKLDRLDKNDHMRHRRYRLLDGCWKPTVCSLDMISEETMDNSDNFIDPDVNIEGNFISDETRVEIREKFRKGWAQLTDRQKALFINIYRYHIPKKRLAEAEGVDPTTIRDRWNTIVNILRSFF